MVAVGTINDTRIEDPESGLPDSGTRYQLFACPVCKKITLLAAFWHDDMRTEKEVLSEILFPNPSDRCARELMQEQKQHWKWMELAISEARSSKNEELTMPKVGAVAVRAGELLSKGHRGELASGDHAEYTVLEKKCREMTLSGATVYTTLEPCTTRGVGKTPCAERLQQRKVSRVVIGMLDPDERIRGRGVLALRKANIQVDLFPPELMTQLEEMNREFIASKDKSGHPAHVSVSPRPPSEKADAGMHPNAALLAKIAPDSEIRLYTSAGPRAPMPPVSTRYLSSDASLNSFVLDIIDRDSRAHVSIPIDAIRLIWKEGSHWAIDVRGFIQEGRFRLAPGA